MGHNNIIEKHKRLNPKSYDCEPIIFFLSIQLIPEHYLK